MLTLRRDRIELYSPAALKMAIAISAAVAMSSAVAHAAGSGHGASRAPVEATRNFDPVKRGSHALTPSPELPQLMRETSQAADDNAQSFLLLSVVVDGATAITHDALEAAYEGDIGRTLTVSDLTAIAERITAIYQDNGFSLSRAIVPPQEIVDGRVRVQVIEGYIDEILVESSDDFGARALLAPLLDERPLKQKTLERCLLLVSDTPGQKIVDTSLDEHPLTSGRFKIVVKLETWRLFAAMGADNRGSAAVGRAQGYVAPAVNSMAVAGDSLDLVISSVPNQPSELRYGRLSYGVPVGSSGARVSANVTFSEVWPGDYRRFDDNYSDTTRFELKGSIPALRTRDASVWVGAGGDVDDVRERDASGLISNDHIRAVTFFMDVELRDSLEGANYLNLSLRQGLTAMGASKQGDPYLSRLDGSGDFTVAALSYSRYQKITDSWSINFSATGQLASTALLSSEEFYLGGAAFGRAYDAGVISGDDALAASLEVRYDEAIRSSFVQGYQLYAFSDAGAVWDFQPGSNERFDLASTGAGIRVFMPDDLQAELEFATPLVREWYTTDTRDISVYLTLSKVFRLCPERPSMHCQN